MLEPYDADRIDPPERDTVTALTDGDDDPPTVVSVSDIHGYLAEGRSALLALADHPDYGAVVDLDAEGRLRWVGGEEYVLVFNGDLIDRGPANEATMTTVARLVDQAPPGHVRVTLGNHEMGLLTPDRFGWDRWYSGSRSPDERRRFLDRIRDGHVVAAYEGYAVTYAHAGRPEPYDAADLNDRLVSTADRLAGAVGTPSDRTVQQEVIESHPSVLGLGGRTGRGPGAGVAWLDFEHMPDDAPSQIVGHTRQRTLTRTGDVLCQNVIRSNQRRDGGEAVVVETPDRLTALVREGDGSVREQTLDLGW
jgi:hypothetical protein